jgi:hypothetical protein
MTKHSRSNSTQLTVKKVTRGTSPLTRPTDFPSAWEPFMNETVPNWVKRTYSPRESWKNRPFSRQDAMFFLKGVRELSDLFTDERPNQLPTYFNHPKFRSSYLLYFLPLQAAKFISLFQAHAEAIDHALIHARLKGALRVADLGSGPGTASLALLLHLLDRHELKGEELPKTIELDWFDTSRGILEEGKSLLKELTTAFPALEGRIAIRTHVRSWLEAPKLLPHACSLILIGNMLNEESASNVHGGAARGRGKQQGRRPDRRRIPLEPEFTPSDEDGLEGDIGAEVESRTDRFAATPTFRVISELQRRTEGGGILLLEPAARAPSRLLSLLRDTLLDQEVIKKSPASLWGPCLHAGRCPLGEGRDWCHFSVPSEIPGEHFRFFSKGLGSERQWLKFSYLWLASADSPAASQLKLSRLRRVISDVIQPPGGTSGARQDKGMVLLCEPETAKRVSSKTARAPDGSPLRRGDVHQDGPEPSPHPARPGRLERPSKHPSPGKSTRATERATERTVERKGSPRTEREDSRGKPAREKLRVRFKGSGPSRGR